MSDEYAELIGTEIDFASSDAWDDTALLNAFHASLSSHKTSQQDVDGPEEPQQPPPRQQQQQQQQQQQRKNIPPSPGDREVMRDPFQPSRTQESRQQQQQYDHPLYKEYKEQPPPPHQSPYSPQHSPYPPPHQSSHYGPPPPSRHFSPHSGNPAYYGGYRSGYYPHHPHHPHHPPHHPHHPHPYHPSHPPPSHSYYPAPPTPTSAHNPTSGSGSGSGMPERSQMPPMPQAAMDDEELSNLLMAWYYSGYQTGRYQALNERR